MRIHQKFNSTPFITGFYPYSDENGATFVVALLKATFVLSDSGGLSIAGGDDQVPLFTRDVYRGDPQKSSLLYPCDVVPRRVGTDVILNGQGYGRGRKMIGAGFSVGDLVKKVVVTGESRWQGLLGFINPSTPASFQSVPLTYEYAYGGSDIDEKGISMTYDYNPVGIGFAVNPAKGTPLPCLQYAKEMITSLRDKPMPAATAPIPPSWPQRCRFSGSYDESWLQRRYPLFPGDFDPRFYNAVPADQVHVPKLSGGEQVVLYDVHPRHTRIDLILPRLSFGVTFRIRESTSVIPMEMDQLLIEPDAGRLALTFRSSLEIGEQWQCLRNVNFDACDDV